MPTKKEECVFCGQPATTNDHIPPQGMFKKPLPKNLITVPACRGCNNNSSLDDQYLQFLALAWESERSQDAIGVKDSIIRNINRSRSKKFQRFIASQLNPVRMYSPDGKFLGNTLAINLDRDRLSKIFEKIIRGLFWDLRKKRLPSDYDIKISFVDQLEKSQDPRLIFVKQLLNLTPASIGDNAFNYAWIQDDEDENTIVWMIQFYGRFKALGETRKKSEDITPT